MINNFSLPICVDLDGTLVYEETLWVLLRTLLKTKPFQLIPLLFIFLCQGRAAFKQFLSRKTPLDPKKLSYNKELLKDLHEAFKEDKLIVLATGADFIVAQKIADYLGIFQIVLASDGYQNLVGKKKATVLSNTFGAGQFIYAGNSWKDIPVWEKAAHMIVVNAPEKLSDTMKKKKNKRKQLKIYS